MIRRRNATSHCAHLALLVLAALAACAGSPAPARAETLNCTPILALPATISQQGVHCLTGNLSTNQTSGAAINVTVPNVTIDLNGWKLGGQGAGADTTATGFQSNQANVTVMNGIVRGFYRGAYLSGRGSVVRDMLLDQNTAQGVYVAGEGAVVAHNHVVATGGPGHASLGILSTGIESTIENNVVSGLSGSSVYGIHLTGNNSVVRDNIVSASSTPAISRAIYVQAYGASLVSNIVQNFSDGILIVSGFENCVYAGNTAIACGTSFSGGTPGHGNSSP
jgi:hypothetical protein